ncbi:Fic family protein [Nitrospira sp. BLG_1]|uniref:Fic family protein n=1 Tax=Nitrospira sp. BLG_1 TaxID=3395883 RepID=UPI0039BD11FB
MHEPIIVHIRLPFNAFHEPIICYNWLMSYNWQQPEWPQFRFDLSALEEIFLTFAEKTGQVTGLVKGLSPDAQIEAAVELMATEALKTSAIEGELLNRRDVLSSIRKNLGIEKEAQAGDKRAIGIATLMTDVRQSFAAPLSQEQLFEWHRMIMEGHRRVQPGQWRTHAEPMQVISGPVGHEIVHFEAPPSSIVPREMARFIEWFNDTGPDGTKPIKKAAVRSAVAHLYFESIHPFEDGNGRVGRALSEKALSQGLRRPALLSLSRVIEAKRNDYYDALQQAQQTNEITPWITWFVAIALEAQAQAEEHIAFTLRKTRLFDRFRGQLNERQIQILQRMLEEGPKGFEGGMSAKKYMSMAGTSKATATRDLQDLAEKGIFVPTGGGRSTHYRIDL